MATTIETKQLGKNLEKLNLFRQAGRQLDGCRRVVTQLQSKFSRSTYQTGRTSTEHEHLGSHLRSNLVQAVSSTRGRLEESSIDIGEVLNLENPASCTTAKKERDLLASDTRDFPLGGCQERYIHTRVSAVFSKTAIHGDTVGLEVFAE